MKKFFKYIVFPALLILAIFWAMTAGVNWARSRHQQRMKAMEDQAQGIAGELTKPATDAVQESWSDALDAYSPPDIDKHRPQRLLNERVRELDEMDAQAREDAEF